MSIIDAVFGNASQVDAGKVQKEHQEIFIPGEELKKGIDIISLQRTLAYYLLNG